eukprot:228616_1
MPKRKSKKHKRVKHVKRKNKHKKSSDLNTKQMQDLRKIIVELMTIVCSKNVDVTKLANMILFEKISAKDTIPWCDPNIDPRKIDYFIHAAMVMVTLAPDIYAKKEILEPVCLAFYLFSCCLNAQNTNHIDKCVEWCIDFFQATQRPTYYPNSLCHKLTHDGFKEPHKKYLQTKSMDSKQNILHYLTLIGELFNHNIISHTFIYDKILNSSVSRQYVNKPLETIQIEILYHLCKICGEKLYEESNNKLMELIYSDYECEICLELVHVKLLPIPCGHVLCTDCMKSGFDLFDGKCPVCG